jgi:hypothetical protein
MSLYQPYKNPKTGEPEGWWIDFTIGDKRVRCHSLNAAPSPGELARTEGT